MPKVDSARTKRSSYRCRAPGCTITGLLVASSAAGRAHLCVPDYLERKAIGCDCANMRGDHVEPYRCDSCKRGSKLWNEQPKPRKIKSERGPVSRPAKTFNELVAQLLEEYLETDEGEVAKRVLELREQHSPHAKGIGAEAKRRADLVTDIRKHIHTI